MMHRYLLDQDRSREWRRQTALMQRLENQFVPKLSTEIYQATADMVDRWKMTNEVTIPRGFQSQIEDIYRQMIVAAATSFGVRIWQQGKTLGIDLERKEDFAETMLREALRYIAGELIRDRITSVVRTTQNSIIKAISRGYVEGLGQKEIGDLIIDSAFRVSEARANRIARTEIHAAANFGAFEAAKRTGLTTKKEWLSAQDPRTRAFDRDDEWDHLHYDGTTVGMDETFFFESVKGKRNNLMYPGDPAGDEANVINCRCTLAFKVDLEALLSVPNIVEPIVPSGSGIQIPIVPTTLKGISEYIVANLISKATKIDGLNILALRQFAKRAAEIHKRFDVKPIEGVGPLSRFGIKGTVKNANAAIYSWERGENKFGIFHMPTKFGNLSDYEKQHTVTVSNANLYKTRAQLRLESLPNLDADVAQRFSRLQSGEYSWTISGLMNPKQKIIGLTDHEYGHVLHLVDRNIGAKIDNFLAQYQPLQKGWGNLLSEYANSNNKEYVAEAFSLYMSDDASQYYRIHPELLKVFQKADRR